MGIVLYMAPVMGFTNSLYRNIYARHFSGFDIAVAPFISSVGSDRISNAHLKELLPENNSGLPVIPQILSNEAEGFIRLAHRFYDLGYDTVNWNLGCPFPMVAKKMRGSGLLPHKDIVYALLDAVLSQIPNTLSIKARAGRNHLNEIFDLFPVFNQFPLSEIVIHPRTGVQMYKGNADPEIFEKCLSLTDIPLVYNGDIHDLSTYNMLSKRFRSIERFMIGRGGISDPFLPGDIKNGRDKQVDRIETFRKFHDELLEQYNDLLDGPGHVLGRMKGYWSFFFLSFRDGKKIFKKIKKAKSIENYADIINRFFDGEPEWIA